VPKRTDISKILVIGSGPIIIGQACEFDYSGTQACKALKAEGYEVILINSNPATIMTDPSVGDRTYIEPITPEFVEAVIERERPDALLPTVGGQTALNVAEALAKSGVLERYGVEMIGANPAAIEKAEDRNLFKKSMEKIGLEVPAGRVVRNVAEALQAAVEIGLPVILRPSFTLGGTGGGVAYNVEELTDMAKGAIDASPIHEVLIEQSVLGWKEFELEVMRDLKDNVVVICSIENFDPMGIHTGDSITVAPVQTLTDREYQTMRDAAVAIIREIGVETGGSNIQFAVHPTDGRMMVIEMNPRVSRSSALASKATGFPIAKIAAKLAAGYTLDEIRNDITRQTPACFEPTIDYCVVKVPRFAFEKFPQTEAVLTTSMRSVGEAMAIGRTFKEALQKALRSLEIGAHGLDDIGPPPPEDVLRRMLARVGPERVFRIKQALQAGMTLEEIHELTMVDPWFLDNMRQIVEFEQALRERGRAGGGIEALPRETLFEAKQFGFSDVQLARLLGTDERTVRERRQALGLRAVYKSVDTCAAEFEAFTPYYYSTYEQEAE
jgi:carbamoyl-phosphate synthase large subunit